MGDRHYASSFTNNHVTMVHRNKHLSLTTAETELLIFSPNLFFPPCPSQNMTTPFVQLLRTKPLALSSVPTVTAITPVNCTGLIFKLYAESTTSLFSITTMSRATTTCLSAERPSAWLCFHACPSPSSQGEPLNLRSHHAHSVQNPPLSLHLTQISRLSQTCMT